MRVLLVTSSVNFVPRNYDDFVASMADAPDVIGLLIIQNKSFKIFLQGVAMILTGAAPRLGLTLLGNFFGCSAQRRKMAFSSLEKPIWTTDNINSVKTLDLLRSLNLDLLLNARTRSIFKEALLKTPRLGCWNIHHGLLPEQRGVMCDFWSHLENKATGFSVHQMTKKIDDGPVIIAQPVSSVQNNYLRYLQAAAQQEAVTCKTLLTQFSKDPSSLQTLPAPSASEKIKHKKNPRLRDFYLLQRKGIKI